VEQDDVTVEEMMDYLRNQLAAENGSLDGIGVLDSQPTASRRSCLFLGMLEMARRQEVEIKQNGTFGPISLTRA
jgi:chromatin segregation and condensation protein Rec8/ScpA/Scc1 (kleisin family)